MNRCPAQVVIRSRMNLIHPFRGSALKFDTTWYLLSNRSMRIRRGIWVIHETTITFENIQNVRLTQGPIERFFRFANLIVDTAGGGASADGQTHGKAHQGMMVGLANATEVRDSIMAKVRQSQSTGLGDERHETGLRGATSGFSAVDIELLADIRDQIARPRKGERGNKRYLPLSPFPSRCRPLHFDFSVIRKTFRHDARSSRHDAATLFNSLDRKFHFPLNQDSQRERSSRRQHPYRRSGRNHERQRS